MSIYAILLERQDYIIILTFYFVYLYTFINAFKLCERVQTYKHTITTLIRLKCQNIIKSGYINIPIISTLTTI